MLLWGSYYILYTKCASGEKSNWWKMFYVQQQASKIPCPTFKIKTSGFKTRTLWQGVEA